jgi:hypothetical protein
MSMNHSTYHHRAYARIPAHVSLTMGIDMRLISTRSTEATIVARNGFAGLDKTQFRVACSEVLFQ